MFASLTDAQRLTVRKGNPLFVEGRLSFYQYETESGERRNKLSVIAERIQLMGQGMSAPPDNMEHPDGEAKEAQPQQASPGKFDTATPADEAPTEGEVTEDDIPF